ncbi:hypothetical protein [Paenibacillus antibioticophila]|nr:hypothetical protein [Paenibacillus antibioticophila]
MQLRRTQRSASGCRYLPIQPESEGRELIPIRFKQMSISAGSRVYP